MREKWKAARFCEFDPISGIEGLSGDRLDVVKPASKLTSAFCSDVGRDDRGSVTVEYTVVLVLVSVVCTLATVALGPRLVRMFVEQEAWLLLPFP